MLREAQGARPLATIVLLSGSCRTTMPSGEVTPLGTSLRKRLCLDELSEAFRCIAAMPGSRPRTKASPSSSTPCTLLGVPRCLSSRPLASSTIGPSSGQPSTGGGSAIGWWSGSLTG